VPTAQAAIDSIPQFLVPPSPERREAGNKPRLREIYFSMPQDYRWNWMLPRLTGI